MKNDEIKLIEEVVKTLAAIQKQTCEEYIACIKAEANAKKQILIPYFFSNYFNYSACRIIAKHYGCSTAAVYSCWKKHKDNYVDFFAAVSKIKKYKKSPIVPMYQWYNSFIFYDLLQANIDKYRVAFLEEDTSHIIHGKKGSYSESLILSESSGFRGLTMPQLIIYMAIQSILHDDNTLCNVNGTYYITLRKIYETIYPTRWDKATSVARQQLWQEVREMNFALAKISRAEYRYRTPKDKIKIDNISGGNLFGAAQWKMIDFDQLNEQGKNNRGSVSFALEKKTNWENCTFV